MNSLLINLCTSVLIGYYPNQACHNAVPPAYEQSGALYTFANNEEKDLQKEALDFYNSLPYNTYIAAVIGISLMANKSQYSLQVAGPLWTSYNGNTYKCELKWGF